MGLGNARTVDIGGYLEALRHAGFERSADKVEQVLARYGIGDETTIYQGGAVGNGAILIEYDLREGGVNTKGFLRFTEKGDLYDGISGNKLVRFSGSMARLFIAGLFGELELTSNLSEYDLILFSAMGTVKGCFDTDASTTCDYAAIGDAKRAAAEEATKAEVNDMLRRLDQMRQWAQAHSCSILCGEDGPRSRKEIDEAVARYGLQLEHSEGLQRKYEALDDALFDAIRTGTGMAYTRRHGLSECVKTKTTYGSCGPGSSGSGWTTDHYDCTVRFPELIHPFEYTTTKREGTGCTDSDRVGSRGGVDWNDVRDMQRDLREAAKKK